MSRRDVYGKETANDLVFSYYTASWQLGRLYEQGLISAAAPQGRTPLLKTNQQWPI